MKSPGLTEQQTQKMKTHPSFIAALDQSGGSTPHALSLYGIQEGAWSNEEEMFAIVHQMRARIITSPSFTGERIIRASGGYSREEANDRLRRYHGIVASFSRALVEGLSARQSDSEFNALLDKSIQSIFDAFNT
jgi:fructose-bisphosphate aldolase class 1